MCGRYGASSDIRPDAGVEDVGRALGAGAVGVTPSLYGMRVRTNAPGGTCDVLAEFARARFGASLVSGVGPGRGKDVLPLPVSGIEAGIDAVAVRKSSTARQMKTMTPSATGIVETAFTAP